MREFAREYGIDPEHEFEAWHDDCLAHGRKYRDWLAAWRTRIRNAQNFGVSRRSKLPAPVAKASEPRLSPGMAELKRMYDEELENKRR